MSSQTHEQLGTSQTLTPLPGATLQRKCDCGQHTFGGGECTECRKKHLPLQRVTRNSETESRNSGGVPPVVHDVLKSPGQPFDATTRDFFEPRFGHDFSRVRVHTDAKAAESAQAVNALAYTVGNEIVFGMDSFRPTSRTGQEIIAHELVHVIQQSGSTPGSPGDLQVDPVHSSAEIEADSAASEILSAGVGQTVHKPLIQAGGKPLAVNRVPIFPSDCNEYDRCKVIEPLRAANQMVDRVLGELPPLASGAVSQGRIVDLLNVHFHDPSNVAGRATIVLDNFRSIKNELNASIRFICHPPAADCTDARGPEGAFTGDQPGGDISLCPAYHSSACPEQARMLIHETCHHIPATRLDRAYVHEAGYMSLPTERATENPDTYAQFSKMVFMGTPSCKDCSSEIQLRPGHY